MKPCIVHGKMGSQMPEMILKFRGVAQLVEQRSPKPRAGGSSPSTPAKIAGHERVSFYFYQPATGGSSPSFRNADVAKR